ncbi:UvrD-helicase domain-containing protein [Methylocystis parvus]|uniref:UvrD-helicase domain-containing protein n=1 Tax=Methylocystis parvus TaxID=134 RepID=UPI0002FF6608|nr:UvrD-helicase domain-containing protein [Methylocystis parvus]WBJ99918.1 AAA family ATPase [Methylocystis parvus OBBP]
MTIGTDDDNYDAEADKTIMACLDLAKPRSFFLYAGAGSGKTRSLVNAIRAICRDQGRHLSLSGRRIGVITYTNSACDEIKQRLEFDPRVEVSTIHSFAWSLIAGYDTDIRQWLDQNLLNEIAELQVAQAKGRPGTKATSDRARSIESKQRRRASLGEIRRFIYSPTGDNRTRDALSHAEVIMMTSDFLGTKNGLRKLLMSRFPILLIDESQDTNRGLMDALLGVQAANQTRFCLGLFGDTMQRIYADGKVGLAEAIPPDWSRPVKRMNHRCPSRVVDLINKVRMDDDGQMQHARSDAAKGVVRLFVLPETTSEKSHAEAEIARSMSQITGDPDWVAGTDAIKTLALEHLMSARRFGFESFFAPLYAVPRIRTGILDGSGAGIGLFTREILPLTQALAAGDRFASAAIIRKSSPLLERDQLEAAGERQLDLLRNAKAACDGLHALCTKEDSPSLLALLNYVASRKLFTIPDALLPFVASTEPDDSLETGVGHGDENHAHGKALDDEEAKSETGAWRLALDATLDQIERYDLYVRGLSPFDTHQGVKGLEFPRVMVIVNDEEARGFLFSYEKLFGAKEKSKTDIDNEAAGKETTIERTRRLFYVTCSRAKQSLAIVYYSSSPSVVRDAMIERGWFEPDEIEIIS